MSDVLALKDDPDGARLNFLIADAMPDVSRRLAQASIRPSARIR